ncbi:MAG: hypothetical protein AB7P04_13495 [Bacteriovoracia bacterium]
MRLAVFSWSWLPLLLASAAVAADFTADRAWIAEISQKWQAADRGEVTETRLLKWKENLQAKKDARLPERSRYLNECEVSDPGEPCDPSRVVLFRGEKSAYDWPAVSGFARTVTSGEHPVCKGCKLADAHAALQKLIQKMRPFAYISDGDPYYYLENKKYWVYDALDANSRIDPSPAKENRGAPGIPYAAALLQIHLAGSEIAYVDRKGKPSSLDSVVSFSFDPGVANAFARDKERKNPGKLYLASVPLDKLSTDCGEKLPPSGEFVATFWCDEIGLLYGEEVEADAIDFVNSAYVFRRYDGF